MPVASFVVDTAMHSSVGIEFPANWLISQGKKMIKRGIAQRRNAHKIFG